MSAAEKPTTQVVTGELHRVRRGHGKRFSSEPTPEAERRPARVAVTLALAHMIQRAIDGGEIRDQAEAARRLGVTRARITQILDLILLAPDLQETILFIDEAGHRETSERVLRRAARAAAWERQRLVVDWKRWNELASYARRGPANGPLPVTSVGRSGR